MCLCHSLLYLSSNITPPTLLKFLVKNHQWLGQQSPRLPERSRMGQQLFMGRTRALPPASCLQQSPTTPSTEKHSYLFIWTRLSRSCALSVPPKPRLIKRKGYMKGWQSQGPGDAERQGTCGNVRSCALGRGSRLNVLGTAPTLNIPFIMETLRVWAEVWPLERAELTKLKS